MRRILRWFEGRANCGTTSVEHERLAAMFLGIASSLGNEPRKILDFGCGSGRLVEAFEKEGLTAYGCDVASYLADDLTVPKDRFAKLGFDPYRLPYPDASFDAVVSTSVLEHAQNTEEAFREIHRVLKAGGLSVHVLPGKWYLPTEPHIYVPLVSWMWPRVPYWWLWLWAALGIRNEFQQSLSTSETTERNAVYCRRGLNYIRARDYDRISLKVFGNVQWPMDEFLRRSDGGVAALWRKVPAKPLIAWLSRTFRMALLMQQKNMSH
jgi:SAM-dependent methyltransferase